jgi:protein TonB
MRNTAAFFYAAVIYALIGSVVWWLFDEASVIAEEFRSTTVTLVSPEESFEDARQMVNSEASEAARAEEAPPEDAKPEEAEPEPEPEPREPKPEAEPKPVVEETPSEPREMEEVMPESLEDPEPPDPTGPEEETPPPFKPLDPVNPQLALDLKCCPSEPVKKAVKPKRKVLRKKRRSAFPARASARSRARRGGSMNASRLLARIKRRIARNKSYPPAAKRRRIQGTVRVSFTITRRGGVRGIRVSGPRLFAASAKSAVRRAFPIDVSRASFPLPKRMSVTLRYRLR